ncbi:MAG: hypothetical protein ACP6IS_04940 [Candidatus Asgardarchaeia archaeon]
MVSFEKHFRLERKILNLSEDGPWPNFKRPSDKDYVFIENMDYLNGSALIINCGDCEGPSYLGNKLCLLCVKEVLRELSSNGKPRPQFIILSRIAPSDVIDNRET